MRLFIRLVSIVAIILAAGVAVLGPGTRFGLWDYGTALGVLRDYLSMPVLAAAALSVVAFALSLWKARSLIGLATVAVLVSAVAGYTPLRMKALVDANPFIHDITTDFENPPQIVAAAALPRKNPAAYAGGEPVRNAQMTVAEAQAEAFPDITPLVLEVDIETAGEAARAVLGKMKMDIIADGPVAGEPEGARRIEAVSTSFWYGFKDDFVVRVTPLVDGATRIDVRSKSRVGLSDLGANARRVRAFMKELEKAL